MKRNSICTVAAMAVTATAWLAVGRPRQCDASEKLPTENPQLAQLHIQLLGVSQ